MHLRWEEGADFKKAPEIVKEVREKYIIRGPLFYKPIDALRFLRSEGLPRTYHLGDKPPRKKKTELKFPRDFLKMISIPRPLVGPLKDGSIGEVLILRNVQY